MTEPSDDRVRLGPGAAGAAGAAGPTGAAASATSADTRAPVEASVRAAGGEDLEAILELGRTAVPATYQGILEPELIELLMAKSWTKDAMIPSLRAGRTFVAHADGELVGLCSFGSYGKSLVVWKLYVAPGLQGRGVGGLLLRAVTERAAELHVPVRVCYTEGNDSAAAFCRSYGLVEVGREEQVGLPELVWMGVPA